MLKNKLLLLSIIITAIFVRVMFLWIGRPEFVGWFNHTYYYYVQVKGLLENGWLHFPDMPLLFSLYGITAKLFQLLGIEQNTAIVYSTRFLMSIIPSLIPIPIYFIAKKINQSENLNIYLWILISASAFLPLSILHQPEFSQKNVLGILFLAFFMLNIKSFLDSYYYKKLSISIGLFILIVLTHFGTTGTVIIYGISLFISYLMTTRNFRSTKKYFGIGFTLVLITTAVIYTFDNQRLDRVFHYFTQSIGTSFVGVLFSVNSGILDKLTAFISIVIPISVTILFFLNFRNGNRLLKDSDKIFWLSNIFFCYFLFFPFYDQLLLARFSVFASLPFLVIMIYILSHSNWKRWRKGLAVLLISFGTLIMIFGEFMSLKMHNRDKEEIFESLMEMKNHILFCPDDLILTKNGAEHICNWFLGTKAGVIPAFNKEDFETYRNIYILNPIEGRLNFQDIENKTTDNEVDRYLFMMRNIPKPENGITLFKSEYMELHKIESPPNDWLYDSNGNWIGYKNFSQ